VIGTGDMAVALAARLAGKGYTLALGSSNPGRARRIARTLGRGAVGGSYRRALQGSEIVVLATDWERVERALAKAGPFEGRIVVDCSNPQPRGRRDLAVGHLTSGAEMIAKWASGARVVKAFNSIYAVALEDPDFGAQAATIFYCGDDATAKSRVGRLIRALGFEAMDAGPLEVARYLEPMGALMSQLVRGQGWPPRDVAFGLLRRGPAASGQGP